MQVLSEGRQKVMLKRRILNAHGTFSLGNECWSTVVAKSQCQSMFI
jgi:hypothetical protein